MVELLEILFVQYPCRNDKIVLLSPWLSLLSQTVEFLKKKVDLKFLKAIKKEVETVLEQRKILRK